MKFANIINWLFGLIVFVDGILNLFWGNDQLLGAAFIVLSFIYFPPSYAYVKKRFGLSIHYSIKIGVGILILWITGAVGAIAEGFVF